MLKKENFVFLLFSIVSMSIGIFTTYLLSNNFSVEDFGKMQFLLSLIGFFSIFNLSGFNITIQKQIFAKDDIFVFFLLKNIMPISLIFLFITALITFYCLEDNSALILPAFIIASFGLFDKTNAILNAKLEFKIMRYLELFMKLVFCCVVVISVYTNASLYRYITIYLAVTIALVLGRIIYTKILLINEQKSSINYKYLIQEGMNTTYSSSFTILASYSEKLILGYLDTSQLAIFTIAQLFPRVIKDNVKIILSPTLNLWASQGFEYYKVMIKKNEVALWGIGILLYIIIYFAVDIIISNFFVKYEGSILIAQLLSITIIFKFIESVKMSSMALSDHTPIFNKINNISNALKMGLVISLVNVYGIYGAVASILTVEILRFLLITKEFNKL